MARRYRHAKAWTRYFIVGTHTLLGQLFDVFVTVLIILGVGALILETVPEVREDWLTELRALETFVGISFSIEYLLRVWTAPRRLRYIFSFWGIIDFMAIFPFLFPGVGIAWLRLFRILRIFSILKIARYTAASRVLLISLKESRSKIGIFLLSVVLIVLMVSFVLHGIEPDTFPTVPHAVWWSIVTISTVGYGDYVPATPLGKTVAAMLMITAYGIIAVPTGIVAAEYSAALQGQTPPPNLACGTCGFRSADPAARFCSRCGNPREEHSAGQAS